MGEDQSNLPAMEEVMPQLFAELMDVRGKLETHYRDMRDICVYPARGDRDNLRMKLLQA